MTDPTPQQFPTVATMTAVNVRYSDSSEAKGGATLPQEQRQGDQDSKDRRQLARLMDRGVTPETAQGQQATIMLNEEQRRQHMLLERRRAQWDAQCERAIAHLKVEHDVDISEVKPLPAPV